MSGAPIRDWVFDLDNTLYPVATIYDAIGARMTAYIASALSLAEAEAHVLRERYFHDYGATAAGLARHHGLDARAFLAYAHDVDYALLAPDPELAVLIAALPGRKILFTNGGGGHGQRALARLGLTDHFTRIFDLEDAELEPKPAPGAYRRLVAACGIDPSSAVLIEDTPRNLAPAHALGFHTVLVGPAAPGPHAPFIQSRAADLKTYLSGYLSGA